MIERQQITRTHQVERTERKTQSIFACVCFVSMLSLIC